MKYSQNAESSINIKNININNNISIITDKGKKNNKKKCE